MLAVNRSTLLLVNEAIKLCSQIQNVDEFEDWCFDNGIYQLPSNGSKTAHKFGTTQKDFDDLHRYDLPHQLGQMSDWLLRLKVPILALIAKQILYIQLIAIEFKYRKFDLNEDLEL